MQVVQWYYRQMMGVENFLLFFFFFQSLPLGCGGRCGRRNSPPASSVMDFIFRRSDGSHVSVDTVDPSLLRYSSFSSPRWYHLQSLSSDVVLVLSDSLMNWPISSIVIDCTHHRRCSLNTVLHAHRMTIVPLH